VGARTGDVEGIGVGDMVGSDDDGGEDGIEENEGAFEGRGDTVG